jgi:hypothetical protein
MVTGIPYAAVFKTEYGDTVAVKDPRKEAYQQASFIQVCLRRRCSVIHQPDGAFTVQGEGLELLTFVSRPHGAEEP